MNISLEYWKFLAGVGLFLYGMERLEDALKDIAGRKFKLFLRKNTKNRFLAILNGVIATAILQSSSIVLLMVIAFAGAGILSLSNSLGIILGANLGTTFTGWLVSTLGFGTKIEAFTFPMITVGSFGLMFVPSRFYIHRIFRFLVAVGLLLLGLEFMKVSMDDFSRSIDFNTIAGYGNIKFFLSGLLLTAIIQSSSAMLTITLAALHANLISLEPAAFIAIGADLGTTMTGLLASFNGTPVKKRVGIAHFFFNVGTAALALVAVGPILGLLKNFIGLTDDLLILVAFHSSFNLLGIIIFFPFLGIFETFLNHFFTKDYQTCTFVHKVGTEIPEASLAAIKKELKLLLHRVLHYNASVIGLSKKLFEKKDNQENAFIAGFLTASENVSEYYEIKKVEDELLAYFAHVQGEKLEDQESKDLSLYIVTLRNAVQSAKSLKDIEHNFKDFGQSITQEDEEFMHQIHFHYFPVFELMSSYIENDNWKWQPLEVSKALSKNDTAYVTLNEWVYQKTKIKNEAVFNAATFLNVNREIYSSVQGLIEALSDLFSKER